MRLRIHAEDHGLIRHVQRLQGDIQDQHTQRQQPQTLIQKGNRHPGQAEQRQAHGRGPLALPAIGQPPCPRRHQHARHAHQPERAHRAVRQRMRRRAQGQHQRGPEGAEGSEHQQRDHAAHAQHALGSQQAVERAQQGPVTHVHRGQPALRQTPRQHHRQHGGQRSGHDVDRAPAPQVRHGPGQRARQQQADHHPALRGADHPAALARRGQRRGQGQQALCHGRSQQAQRHHAHQQPGRAGRQRHGRQRQDQQRQLPQHQAPAVQQVAQRHHEQKRQRAAQLGGRDHDAYRAFGDAELSADGVQQGLGVIHVGHAQGAGHRQQHHQGPGHRTWGCGIGGFWSG
ncbi:hypothetical protein ACAE110713_24320 [Achromobacter aegrifaciens]